MIQLLKDSQKSLGNLGNTINTFRKLPTIKILKISSPSGAIYFGLLKNEQKI